MVLGVVIEANPHCTKQLEEAAARAAQATKAIGDLLANMGDPCE